MTAAAASTTTTTTSTPATAPNGAAPASNGPAAPAPTIAEPAKGAPAVDTQAAPATADSETSEAKPDPDKLTKWSSKLARRERRTKEQQASIATEKAAIEKQRAELAERLKLADLLDSDDELALIDAYAQRKGKKRHEVHNRLTARLLNPDEVPLEDQVKTILQQQQEAAEQARKEQGSKFQQARDANFKNLATPYIKQQLPAKYPYLAGLPNADAVANAVIAESIHRFNTTGKETGLDELLIEWNDQEKARVERLLTSLRPGDQVEANSAPAGAVEPAKRESRKGKTVTNAHASTKASPTSEDEDLSDRALRQKAADAVRRANLGWR